MNSFGFNFNKKRKNAPEKEVVQFSYASSRQVRNPYSEQRKRMNYGSYQERVQGSVISGYFVQEKTYREIMISRVNTALCIILAVLVAICLVSYYFVVVHEVAIQKLNKETIALNYDNQDMQNKLDRMQSLSNVDMQVSKSNILKRAKEVIELPLKGVPSVYYDPNKYNSTMNWSLGY